MVFSLCRQLSEELGPSTASQCDLKYWAKRSNVLGWAMTYRLMPHSGEHTHTHTQHHAWANPRGIGGQTQAALCLRGPDSWPTVNLFTYKPSPSPLTSPLLPLLELTSSRSSLVLPRADRLLNSP
jgi:hypothetical protein